MSKKVFTKISNPELSVVNNETGEIISGVATIKTSSIDEFGLLFLRCLKPCLSLGATQIKILLCCWKYSKISSLVDNIKGNYFTNNKDFKNFVVAEGLQVTENAINTAISRLRKVDLILPTEAKGSYLLNPKYFFKGSLAARSKLQLHIL